MVSEREMMSMISNNVLISKSASWCMHHRKIYSQFIQIYSQYFEQQITYMDAAQQTTIKHADTQKDLIKYSQIRVQSTRQKMIDNFIHIVHQVEHNLSQMTDEEIRNDTSDLMLENKQMILSFDLSRQVTLTLTQMTRLEKTKNILEKEMQNLKAYCMDKTDRAKQ